MNTVLKIFLSMSFSGSVLILVLLLGKRFLMDKISRQWQYYVWLIVIARLLLPFGFEINLMGKTYQAVEQAVTQAVPLYRQQNPPDISVDIDAPAAGIGRNGEKADSPAEVLAAARPFQDIVPLLINYSWLVWLAAALGMLIQRITSYQNFIRFVNAGLTPIADIEILDRLSTAAEQAGIKRPVELGVNPLVSSPLIIGFFRPCIVLPGADISEKDFRYIVLHELTHYKRRDMFYKWLVQVTVCLHWFNPLVHLMGKEITKACEFSCDEAVLVKIGCDKAQDYGNTLLDAMAAVGKYRESLGAVTLSENKQLLKERLGAIMKFQGQSKPVKALTAVLTLCVALGAAFVGIYPRGDAANVHAANIHSSAAPAGTDENNREKKPAPASQKDDTVDKTAQNPRTGSSTWAEQAERYYENSLPLFQIVFPRLDEEAQGAWLDRIYADREIAYFSVCVGQMGTDNPLIWQFAEKSYQEQDISFFSVLIRQMSGESLNAWLNRALEEEQTSFQMVLFNELDMEEEQEALEKELEEKQMADYRSVGVTRNGKSYYYQGQLVDIFLDIRQNKSFYVLDMNPAGVVNIKIIRDKDDKITGVSYMTEAEVTELFGSINSDDE